MQTADLVDRLSHALVEREPLPGNIRIDLGEDGVIFINSTTRSAILRDNEAPLSLTTTLADCTAILNGDLSPTVAVLSGRLSLTGDMVAAMHLYRLLGDS